MYIELRVCTMYNTILQYIPKLSYFETITCSSGLEIIAYNFNSLFNYSSGYLCMNIIDF